MTKTYSQSQQDYQQLGKKSNSENFKVVTKLYCLEQIVRSCRLFTQQPRGSHGINKDYMVSPVRATNTPIVICLLNKEKACQQFSLVASYNTKIYITSFCTCGLDTIIRFVCQPRHPFLGEGGGEGVSPAAKK